VIRAGIRWGIFSSGSDGDSIKEQIYEVVQPPVGRHMQKVGEFEKRGYRRGLEFLKIFFLEPLAAND